MEILDFNKVYQQTNFLSLQKKLENNNKKVLGYNNLDLEIIEIPF
jgi:hypothetical protein